MRTLTIGRELYFWATGADMDIHDFIKTLNAWGSERKPFLFVIDFEMEKPVAFQLRDIDPKIMLFDCNGITNAGEEDGGTFESFAKLPISKSDYAVRFDVVRKALEHGDSYLTNLTVKTRLQGTIDLKSLFAISKAKYKLWMRDLFLVFSPETFVQIIGDRISTFPMKGTIDASLENAEERILNDPKELAEHVTIVDLLRNDLSMVADNVIVKRFRYIEEIRTSHKRLLQVSSEITGELPADYHNNIGSLLVKLLPAGSVSGAPKPKTIEIISDAEGEKRGYYTGVFGVYNGQDLDSAVMIRFIEKSGDTYYYRSGGGITTQSDVESEYQEAIDKVYVPVN
jgi:para-aminobenzoate synthetase component I